VTADLDTRTVTDAVADALSGQILSGRWAPGTLVSEVGVKREFGVSRPTARAAIERMVAVGLLKRDAYRSAHVPIVDAQLVEDVYLAREAIEAVAASRAARDGATIVAAIAAAEAIGRLGDDCSVSDVVALDVAFHRAVVDAANSTRLSRMHVGLMGEMQLCMADVRVEELMSVQEIAEEHLEIADAIQRRDQSRAAQATTQHLWHARDALLSRARYQGSPRD
jgi:DNA-binding GntR family transcriptional regulator